MLFLFCCLSFVCLLSSILLISCKNPVYSVLSLVLLFVCGSILLILLGADFLGFVFIVVYAGALAVLFLFVVIMLNIKVYNKIFNFKNFLFVLFFSLAFFLGLDYINQTYLNPSLSQIILEIPYDKISNLNALGQVLYTEYVFHFIICGIVLLVAMIGAIYLTSRQKTTSLKQKLFKQSQRSSIIGKYKS